MAQPLLALAVAAAIGPAINPPGAPPGGSLANKVVPAVVARTLNATAEVLAQRRNPGRGRLGKPVPVRVLDRIGLRAALSPPPRPPPGTDRETESALFEQLGLGLGDRLAGPPADVSGHYDVSARAVLIGDWVDLEAARFTLARDAALAVLDRRFNLARWLAEGQRGSRVNSDAALARQAVAEGDAAVQALELVDPQGVLPAPRALAEITEGLRDGAIKEAGPAAPRLPLARRLFATLDGLRFVAHLRARLPWSEVDQIWREPPRSSEQILHPAAYRRGDQPDDVGARLPTRLRGGWRIAFADTLGELGTRVFLEGGVDGYRAERAATGWGGDRVLWLQSVARARKRADTGAENEGFAAWITTWDDESDADDFAAEAAVALAALARVPPPEGRPPAGGFRVENDRGRVYALQRRQRAVALVFGAPAGSGALLAELTAAASRGRGARSRSR